MNPVKISSHVDIRVTKQQMMIWFKSCEYDYDNVTVEIQTDYSSCYYPGDSPEFEFAFYGVPKVKV